MKVISKSQNVYKTIVVCSHCSINLYNVFHKRAAHLSEPPTKTLERNKIEHITATLLKSTLPILPQLNPTVPCMYKHCVQSDYINHIAVASLLSAGAAQYHHPPPAESECFVRAPHLLQLSD